MLMAGSLTWVLLVENCGVIRAVLLPGGAGRIHSLPVQPAEAALIPWLMAPFLHLQRQQ